MGYLHRYCATVYEEIFLKVTDLIRFLIRYLRYLRYLIRYLSLFSKCK